jgi:hypothetical protein
VRREALFDDSHVQPNGHACSKGEGCRTEARLRLPRGARGITKRRRSTEKRVGGTERIDVSNEKVGAPTEIRIAPAKTFAASSGKDDAPAEKIE